MNEEAPAFHCESCAAIFRVVAIQTANRPVWHCPFCGESACAPTPLKENEVSDLVRDK